MSSPLPSTSNVVPLRQPSHAGQLPLLPLRVDAAMPAPFGSADLKHLVRTMDGHVYAVKTAEEGPGLPASEFICYKLAAACGLPVPYSALIELEPGGALGFGSRFEGGIQEPKQLSSTDQFAMFKESKGPISAIISLDHFVGNEDRHRGNFIWRKNYLGSWVPLAIDYSRAMFVRGFPLDVFPIPAMCNTKATLNMMKASDLWDGPFAVFALSSLQGVTSDHLSHWLDEMPIAWMDQAKRKELVQWWGSDAFGVRLQAVYQQI